MKDLFFKLALKRGDYSSSELIPIVDDFVAKLVELNNDTLLSVDREWAGYGTWRSRGWANKAFFGEDLGYILEKALHSKITHDEDYKFNIKDFEDVIGGYIYDYLY